MTCSINAHLLRKHVIARTINSRGNCLIFFVFLRDHDPSNDRRLLSPCQTCYCVRLNVQLNSYLKNLKLMHFISRQSAFPRTWWRSPTRRLLQMCCEHSRLQIIESSKVAMHWYSISRKKALKNINCSFCHCSRTDPFSHRCIVHQKLRRFSKKSRLSV